MTVKFLYPHLNRGDLYTKQGILCMLQAGIKVCRSVFLLVPIVFLYCANSGKILISCPSYSVQVISSLFFKVSLKEIEKQIKQIGQLSPSHLFPLIVQNSVFATLPLEQQVTQKASIGKLCMKILRRLFPCKFRRFFAQIVHIAKCHQFPSELRYNIA